ncbi:MAG: NAD-dependent epimerase/dehydratase family protein [Calditrichaeota bacterium]|nr:MAG: NAD-dependent epimerase/dehydratase family protein [Calditrichota bacterium]
MNLPHGGYKPEVGAPDELAASHHIFITGGTGYIGRHLVPVLLARNHRVRLLCRDGSEKKAPEGCEIVPGDALQKSSFQDHIGPCDTFLHMVGVSHPNPLKSEQFKKVDLASVYAAVDAAQSAGIRHFIYISVGQPAPVMKSFTRVRAECEALIRTSGLAATIVRPWYVLGPGHRWPYALMPVYWLLERIPSTRSTALRLGLVKLENMLAALVHAVEHPCRSIENCILEVQQIRNFHLNP